MSSLRNAMDGSSRPGSGPGARSMRPCRVALRASSMRASPRGPGGAAVCGVRVDARAEGARSRARPLGRKAPRRGSALNSPTAAGTSAAPALASSSRSASLCSARIISALPKKRLAGVGKTHSTSGAFQQRHPGVSFQRSHLLGDGRLRVGQRLGGRRQGPEAAPPRGRPADGGART
jgi:hypothetical protein